MEKLKAEEAAYIAGIVDGEGTITLTSHKKGNFPSPTISVASSDIELLLWLKGKIGKGTISKKRNYNTEKHKDSWSYMLKQNYALDILQEIEPYLVINSKKARANFILNNYKKLTPRNGIYTKEMLEKKFLFIETFFKLK